MPGLYRRVIGGHWSMSPSMAKLAAGNLFEAYCLPAGIPAEGLEFGAAYNSTAIIGTGGFIDIAQKARKVVFCGTLAVRGGKPKFVPAVRQITFSGANAVSTGQEVLYVTEAAVFRLTAEGLQLEEVAPSLDAECDVVAKMAFRPLVGASLGRMRTELFAPPLLPADCFPAFQ
jgi:acyl CoA:acetate/3-ketoacid CoA transferase